MWSEKAFLQHHYFRPHTYLLTVIHVHTYIHTYIHTYMSHTQLKPFYRSFFRNSFFYWLLISYMWTVPGQNLVSLRAQKHLQIGAYRKWGKYQNLVKNGKKYVKMELMINRYIACWSLFLPWKLRVRPKILLYLLLLVLPPILWDPEGVKMTSLPALMMSITETPGFRSRRESATLSQRRLSITVMGFSLETEKCWYPCDAFNWEKELG